MEYWHNWQTQHIRKLDYLSRHGLYLPHTETAGCGVGAVVSIDGSPRRETVLTAIEALQALWHRGAVDADGKTGDGAGIHLQIPHEFFREHVYHTGYKGKIRQLAVGMVFLPRCDFADQERTRQIIEAEILSHGYRIYGWRQVPVNTSVIGGKANIIRPEIEQIMVDNTTDKTAEQFETHLYIMRRRIENILKQENLQESYICSLSAQSIIYKGLFLAEQLANFYPDLQDERFISNFALYHQRFSTNTFPSWSLAQPFRVIAHNGEINTLPGNINWMKSHEVRMQSQIFKDCINDLKPVIPHGSSDSAALDAVCEIMLKGMRELPEVKGLLMPEAWENNDNLPQNIRDFYQYAHGIMEPWDGPAGICAYSGDWVLAWLDRNGLRPMRFAISDDGLLILGSETGMTGLSEDRIRKKGQIGPGEMIGVNLRLGEIFYSDELKQQVAELKPFGKWITKISTLSDLKPHKHTQKPPHNLRPIQTMSGWSMEDLELILAPMCEEAKEATGSMGDDSPLAVLSHRYHGFHHYFRQNFSQVTNPPIDSLRERHVMSLTTRFGNLGNILEESERQMDIVQLPSPILLNDEAETLIRHMSKKVAHIDCYISPQDAITHSNDSGASAHNSLRCALMRISHQASDAVAAGKSFLVLDNTQCSKDKVPIPMILAAGVLHSHLQKKHLRSFASITVRCSDALDVHHFAILIGVGVSAINPTIAQYTIAERVQQKIIRARNVASALANYRTAVEDGLLKIMSKMGISVISSYRGGYIFEAIGLSRGLVNEFFPGLLSRISGIGLHGLEKILLAQHKQALQADNIYPLPVGGFYRFRQSQEPHGWEAESIHLLQTATAKDSYSTYKKYAESIYSLPAIHLRDLLGFRKAHAPISLEKVASITEIRKRLVAPGISLGALSPIAHETLSIAMNRIGAKSDSGEGGEDPKRYRPKANGDNPSSAIKQVASGRFGVTAEYLNNCKEIEIKIAQGAKPGEGGQLPGFKVSDIIARLRHSTKGVTLISPPPHHDIYSIEDLAQLIYDLKQINPQAKVCVKLVARSGIGTIAAGVAKAYADVILISGHSGGTGASPQTSIKYAGLSWELGLSETHQVLCLNNLRQRVTLRVDGGIKTGRDVVIAAILGAEEYGIGTGSLIAMGCLMVRQCHSNTCPVGVCTQDPKLIKKFAGTPEKVVNLYSFIAEEVREILASIGFDNLDNIIGRTDLLAQVSRGDLHLDNLDLNPLLVRAENNETQYFTDTEQTAPVETLDEKMIKDAASLFSAGEKMQLQYNIRNTNRTIGACLSSKITRQFGMTGLQAGHLNIKLRGSAGQSLGAFAVQGLYLEVRGDANDYVGKGLSGGEICLRPPLSSSLLTQENVIIGNTCLYGATAGKLFAAGRAGERFAVRNSGAIGVAEGCGSNGCEYMTGGEVLILGAIGSNFAAGMTGGWAFVLDGVETMSSKINMDTVEVMPLPNRQWQEHCYDLIAEHVRRTESQWGNEIINNWQVHQHQFLFVVPKELIKLSALPYSVDKVEAKPAEANVINLRAKSFSAVE